jgi:hypothetical protein
MCIRKSIEAWDGKSADEISRIYDRYASDELFIRSLIPLIKVASCESGVSWLLKHYLEEKRPIDDASVDEIFKCLAKLNDWQSKLNLLQCLCYFKISKSNRKRLELFLRASITNSNKFVRAWAYNGFYELAMQYPQYREETESFFEMALRDEAPSVKARIRNIMKKGF